MRRASKVDLNHGAIAGYFKDLGWSVVDTHALPNFVDMVVSKPGLNILVEVKNGALCKSARKLRTNQVKFHEAWQGPKAVIESFDDVAELNQEYADARKARRM